MWITGASSGIGACLAREVAARGAHLVLSARREVELREVAATCGGAASVSVVPLDLADGASLATRAREVVARHGHVDVVVHNGGISQRARAVDSTIDVDRRVMEVNYFGTVALTKALLPSMMARRAGHFVVVSSLVGKFGTPLRSGYSASKHALHGFFDSLRAEHARDGLHVTIICPGFINTDPSRRALTGDGTPVGAAGERHGLRPEVCAARMLRAIEARKREVYIGGKEVLAVYVKRCFPGLFARLIARVRVT